jgi:hypothetical protein
VTMNGDACQTKRITHGRFCIARMPSNCNSLSGAFFFGSFMGDPSPQSRRDLVGSPQVDGGR